jgi:hypothetical protein
LVGIGFLEEVLFFATIHNVFRRKYEAD